MRCPTTPSGTCCHERTIIIKGCEFCQQCHKYLSPQLLLEFEPADKLLNILLAYEKRLHILRKLTGYSHDANKDLPTVRECKPSERS